MTARSLDGTDRLTRMNKNALNPGTVPCDKNNIIQRIFNMEKKKLIIQPHRYGGETQVISLRLPKEMLKVIDEAASATGRTRNEILVLSMEYALENMVIEER